MNHARTRRLTAGAVAATMIAGLLTLLGWTPSQAAPPPGASLQVIKEITSTGVGQQITLTAVMSANALLANPVRIAFEFEGGPYEGDVSSNTADEFCTIDPGDSECTLAVTSNASGTGLVRAWIDSDNKDGSETNGVREADTGEARLANTTTPTPIIGAAADCRHPEDDRDTQFDTCTTGTADAGDNPNEPDNTDVVQVRWTDAVSVIDCFDSNATNGSDVEVNSLNQDETITCRATDGSGNLVGGTAIDGEHDGMNDPEADGAAGPPDYDWTTTTPPDTINDTDTGCETDDNGECTILIDAIGQSSNTNFAKICFFLDTEKDTSPPTGFNGDHDYTEAGSASDGGGCDDEKASASEDPDATDVVSIQWRDESSAAKSVDVTTENAAGTVGSAAAVTATAYDQFGDKMASAVVSSELFSGSPGDSDANDPTPADATCTTGAAGTCNLSFSAAGAGTARLCTFVGGAPAMTGDNTNGTCGADNEGLGDGTLDAKDVSRILWTAPQSSTTTTTTQTQEDVSKTQGYSLVGADGGIFNYGTSQFHGSTGDIKLNKPIIGMANKKGGTGYWLVASDGGIFTFGDADFYGSTGDKTLNAPILGMEATPSGKGYYLFAADGGIFTFGDAAFHGSTGDMKLNAPAVGMAVNEKGDGYWLVAQDGGIFSFGEVPFHGSTGSMKLNQPVFDMAPTAGDKGYFLLAKDGGLFSFGDAESKFKNSGVGSVSGSAIGMGMTPSSNGYWIADSRGAVFPFGDATFLGDRRGNTNNAATVGFATVPKK